MFFFCKEKKMFKLNTYDFIVVTFRYINMHAMSDSKMMKKYLQENIVNLTLSDQTAK